MDRTLIGVIVGVLLLTSAALGQYVPSPPFNAVGPQGRPLTGATIAITTSAGAPITVYSNGVGAAFNPTVSGTGLVQFYAASGNYIVTISGSGVSKTYAVNIPAVADALAEGNFGSGTGLLRKNGPGSYTTLRINTADIADPTINEDTADGFGVGSYWINIVTNKAFMATSVAAGAAVWKEISNSASVPNHSTQHSIGSGDEVEFYGAIGDEGLAVTQRRVLNFIGAGVACVDNAGLAQTNCTISGGGGGGGITTLNTLTADPQLFATGSSGTDFNISSTASTHSFNIPSATTINRGLVTVNTQTFSGDKNFNGTVTANAAATINEGGNSLGNFRVETDTQSHAFFVDATNNRISFFTSATVPGFDIWVDNQNNNIPLALSATGAAGLYSVSSNSHGVIGISNAVSAPAGGIFGSGTGVAAYAGQFQRDVAAATVPVMLVSRNNGADSTSILSIHEQTIGSAPYMLEGKAGSDIVWGLNSVGQLLTAGVALTGYPELASIVDSDSGIDLAGSLGTCIVDEGVELICANGAGVVVAAQTLNMLTGGSTGSAYFANLVQSNNGNGLLVNNNLGATGTVALKATNSADFSTVNAGVFETTRGTTLYARQTGSTASTSGAAVLQAQRNTTLTGGAALSGPVIRGMDDAATTGDLLSLERPALTYMLRVTNAGELIFAGVSADGTGKTLCVKADSAIGTCSTVPNASGVCTCG